jgi:hypothetical protein
MTKQLPTIDAQRRLAMSICDKGNISVRFVPGLKVARAGMDRQENARILLPVPEITKIESWLWDSHHEISHLFPELRFTYECFKLRKFNNIEKTIANILADNLCERVRHGTYKGRDRLIFNGRKDYYLKNPDVVTRRANLGTKALYVWDARDRLEWQGVLPNVPYPKEVEPLVAKLNQIDLGTRLKNLIEQQDVNLWLQLIDEVCKILIKPEEEQQDEDNKGETGQPDSGDGGESTEPEGDDSDASDTPPEGDDSESDGDGDESDDDSDQSGGDGDEPLEKEGGPGDSAEDSGDSGEEELGDTESREDESDSTEDEGDVSDGDDSDNDGDAGDLPSGDGEDDGSRMENRDDINDPDTNGSGEIHDYEEVDIPDSMTLMEEDTLAEHEIVNEVELPSRYRDEAYVPFTEQEKHEITPNQKTRSFMYEGINKEVAASSVSKKITKFLKIVSKTTMQYGRKEGRIHSKNLYRLCTGVDNPRVFKQKNQPILKQDSAVSILMDCSGSMGRGEGSKYYTAAACCIAMSETLTSLRISHEILGFSEDYGLLHYLFKPFDSRRMNRDKLLKAFSASNIKQDCNADGESILWAAERLYLRKEKNKMLMVLSDGQPAGDFTGNGRWYLREVCKRIEASEIDLIGIGIKTTTPRKYYKNCEVVQNIQDLDEVLFKTLKRNLTT